MSNTVGDFKKTNLDGSRSLYLYQRFVSVLRNFHTMLGLLSLQWSLAECSKCHRNICLYLAFC